MAFALLVTPAAAAQRLTTRPYQGMALARRCPLAVVERVAKHGTVEADVVPPARRVLQNRRLPVRFLSHLPENPEFMGVR